MTVIRFEPGLRPVLKHGDPSRPGYAALHPDSPSVAARSTPVTAEQIADAFTSAPLVGDGVTVDVYASTIDRQPIEAGGPDVPIAGGELLDADGYAVGEWARAVEGTTMHAVLLTVGKTLSTSMEGDNSRPMAGQDVRRKGLALAFQKRTEEAARALGCTTIRVHAANDGSAAWAQERFGYRFAKRPTLRGSSTGKSLYHSEGDRPEVKARLADIERRFRSDNPDDWPAPHEVLAVGGARRDDNDIAGGRTYGEFILSWGWDGVKPSTHVTKAVGSLMHLIVDSEEGPVAKHGSPGRPGYAQMHPNGSKATATGEHPAVGRLKAGKPVIVQPRDVADVVEAFRGSSDGPVDLTNLHVAGLGLFGGDGLGIPREDMPQIPKAHRDKFFDELRAQGVDVHNERVDPTVMKPTQREMDAVNVAGMAHGMRTGSFKEGTHTLIASSDGYILDGHHRYAAAVVERLRTGTGDMGIARVDMPIRQLLEAAQSFNEREGIAARGLGDHARRVHKAACDRAEALSVLKHLQTDDGRAWASVVKFAPGLVPVLKHGHHNQKDHGRRFSTTLDPEVAAKAIRLVGENGGLSIKMTDGSEPDSGFMVARDSVKYGTAMSADAFYGPDGGAALGEFLVKNRSELGSGRAYLGVWHQKTKVVDGVEIDLPRSEQVVHLDVTDNIPVRDRAERLGRRRNQISIWDVANFEEIQTHGTGAAVVKGTVRVRQSEADERDDGRRTARVGQADPRGDGGPRQRVLKHGDPSRPGYAALHPNSKATATTALPEGWAPRDRATRLAEYAEQAKGWGPTVTDESAASYAEQMVGDLDIYDGPNGMSLTVRPSDNLPHGAITEQMKVLSALQTLAPIPGLPVVVSDGPFEAHGLTPSTKGYVIHGEDRIYLRPVALTEGVNVHSGRLMPVFGGQAHLYATVHEYGHVLDRRSEVQSSTDKADVITKHQTGMSRYAFDDEPTGGAGREAFAEAFVGWVGSQGRMAQKPGMVKFFADKYGWDAGDEGRPPSAGFAKAAPGTRMVLGDTFTEEGPIVRVIPATAVVKFAPGLRPVLKHGDPSRPGYAQQHPGSAATRLRPRPNLSPTVRGKPRVFTTDDPSDPKNLSPESQDALRSEMDRVFGITDDQIDANLEALFVRAEASGALDKGMEWYEHGGDVMADRATAVGLTREHGNAVAAAMSPQREWESNVVVADYVMGMAVRNPEIPALDRTMSRDVRIPGVTKNTEVTKTAREWLDDELTSRGLGTSVDVVGRRLDTLDPRAQAVIVRVMSQAGYYTGPGGSHNGPLSHPAVGKDGKPKMNKVSWGAGDNPTIKGLAIARTPAGPALQKVTEESLHGMKVRSFYNNLNFGEHSAFRDVTMDTHALSAALGRVVPAKSPEGDSMFSGPPSSTTDGFKGTYPVFAAAYRRVAKAHGLQPYQVQAALWVQWRHETDGMPIATHSDRG